MVLRKTLSLFVCLFVALISLAAHAQQPAGAAAATVHGIVTDPDNALIPGATVTLTPAKGKAIVVQSGSDGAYTAHGVAPGAYTMTVTMTGFATFVRENVHITAQSLAIDVKMALQVESQQIQVTAQSAQVSVDSDSNASSTVIKGKDLDALSDDPDELSSELSALAGPSAGPNGGQIYVDGFTGGQLPPKSSIREIRINQNPFSAQYDKLGYGRVEVFTKPGTDKYHGNFSMQGGDKSFNTSNPFLGPSNTQPDYHTIFMFGNISGPINHFSSFSVGGSHRDIEDNSIVNPSGFYATSSTSTTPCKPGTPPPGVTCSYFTSYPVANRAVAHPQTRSDISPRLDLALGEKNTLTFRYQYEVSDVQNAGVGNTSLPTVGYNSHSNENTIQISDTQIVSSRVINETRFEYQRAASSTDPLDKTPTLSVQGIFTAGGSSQGTQRSASTHIEVQNYTSVALEKNFMRLGARMRTNSQSTTSDQGANGTFTYSYLLDPCTDPNQTKRPSSCNPGATVPCAASNATGYISSYQCGTPGQFAITKINNATIGGRVTDIGLYAEDDWKIKPNLTLTLGARYEAQNVIHSNHDFAPRIAFAWGIPRAGGKSPITVIRGGYGIFYDRFGLGNYLNTVQLNGVNQQRSTFINPGVACTPDNPANCGTATPSRSTQYTLGNNIRSSYTLQAALGIDQQLGRAATMSVNYLNARGVHQFMARNFYDSAAPTTPYYDFQYQSGGVFRQNQLMFNGRAALRNANLFGFYAISFADANTSGAGFIPTSNTNTKVDYGRATFAFRQFGVFGGSVNLPYLISLSPFMIAQAGTPYNIISGTDPLGSSIYNTRPYFANGNSGNCAVASDFSATQTGSLTPVPINYCTGPANVSINLRVAKVFGFGPKTGAAAAGGGSGGGPGGGRRGGPGGGGGGRGGGPMGMGGPSSGHRYSLTLGAQASNLFNMVPYGTPTSTLTSPRFGQFTTLSTGPFSSQTAVRRIMLQATFNF
ncbi:MAG: TonB-dependent receptor [Acidobacteria bacterium]|nr:TonB-dependent receptor [Acidobacteriota bacterium]